MKKLTLTLLTTLLLVSCQQRQVRIVDAHLIDLPAHTVDTTNNPMQQFINQYKGHKDTLMNVVIGQATQRISRGLPEGSLNKLFTDALMEYGKKQMETDIAISNFGGLRSSIEKGPITVGNIYEVSPFDNEVVFIKLGGDDLEDLCEAIARKGGEVQTGISMTIVKDEEGEIEAENVLINGKPINEDRIYTIITVDYLSFGNDKLGPMANYLELIPTRTKLRDLIMSYIKSQTALNKPINPSPKQEIYVAK